MTLLSPNSVTIRLPMLLAFSEDVERNKVRQLANPDQVITARAVACGGDCYMLEAKSFGPLYLRLPGCRISMHETEYALRLADGAQQSGALDTSTRFKWYSHPLTYETAGPEAVAEEWRRALRYVCEDELTGSPGLRECQLGAIHALAAHWTVSDEAATIAMPTGTGKTEVMIAALVVGCCRCVLIIVPSATLRKQTANKIAKYGCLQEIGVLPYGIPYPRVTELQHTLTSVSEVKRLCRQSNVIVATASVLHQSKKQQREALQDCCTHLFVDEAHHLPAKTWHELKQLFRAKPILQFTATPFRRDGKPVEGKTIYHYPMALAQKNHYFSRISLVEVETYLEYEADMMIARAATRQLKNDVDNGYDHVLMARTKTKKRADELLKLYISMAAEFRPIVVHSGLSSTVTQKALAAVTNRNSRIVICVDMLGEGFDLPNLKIAAIHDIHKSFAVTMQFIGRLTRVAKGLGDATVVVNIRGMNVASEIDGLYAEEADWNKVLQTTSDSIIAREITLQKVMSSFTGELSNQVSLWSLRPNMSTLVYATKCKEWRPESLYLCIHQNNHWRSVSHLENMAVVVVHSEEDVKWGKCKDIHNSLFDMMVVYWSHKLQMLFIQCTDYSRFNCEEIAKALCGYKAKLITGKKTFNVFDGIDWAMVGNLGASASGLIRYTMYFGTDVVVGLSQVEKAESMLNNVFGWGYVNGDKVSIGCSARNGKIWSWSGGAIHKWKDWCNMIGGKLSKEEVDVKDIIAGFLCPEAIDKRPDIVALSAEWGQRIVAGSEENTRILFKDTEVSLREVDLRVLGHSIDEPIRVQIQAGKHTSVYELQYEHEKCRYVLVSGEKVFVSMFGRKKKSLEEYCVRDPIVILYAGGSFSFNHYYVPLPDPRSRFGEDKLITIDWKGVDLKKESQGRRRDPRTIQYRISQILKKDYELLFDDDDSGEAADLVGIRQSDIETLELHLIHCKYSSEPNAGSRVGDFYEVCGQAQKCVKWKHKGMHNLVQHMVKREETWTNASSSRFTRFIAGDVATLWRFDRMSRNMKVDIYVAVVQPGLSKDGAGDDILQLLGATEHYLIKTANASLRVYCSQ